jgi:phage-related protein
MPTLDSQTIELAFIAVAALALILQTIFLIVLATTISKSARSALDEIENMRSAVMPVIYNAREMITRVSPKIEEAADEITELTHSLRAQTADVQAAASEVISRVHRITARLDGMASTVLDNVERAAEFMSETVARPMRQITGVVASVRAIVDAMRNVEDSPRSQAEEREPVEPRSREPRSSDPEPTEKDMFV